MIFRCEVLQILKTSQKVLLMKVKLVKPLSICIKKGILHNSETSIMGSTKSNGCDVIQMATKLRDILKYEIIGDIDEEHVMK